MKKISAFVLVLTIIFSLSLSTFATDGYADVASDEWYFKSVEYVTKNGMMQGIGNNCFEPEGTTTRGMIAVVLHRHAGTPPGWVNIFSDLTEADWYYDAALWCHIKGIVLGYENNPNRPQGGIYNYSHQFKGEQTVTREELACFLYRYAKYAGADVSETASLEGFADAASISDWAEEALGWCVAEGILQGTPAGDSLNLAPADHATRAEVAAMLMRYGEMIKG